MNARRMESQVVRDSLLQLSGTLDATLGGPSLDVGNASRRRSLYFKHSRDQQDKFLTMFDDADLLACYRRSESIVPQQALALSNSQLSLSLSKTIAERLFKLNPGDDLSAFAGIAFEAMLARQPDTAERDECRRFIDELTQLYSDSKRQDTAPLIRTRLVHALLNHNDFVSIR
jgi:hypothetical protein